MAALALLVTLLLGAAAAEPAPERPAEKPLIIVYPFKSEFDEGRLGGQVRACLRGHALRGGKVTAFDSLSEDEKLAARPLAPAPDTPLEELAAHAREVFGAGYAVWGEVRKKDRGDGYALRVLGARVGKDGAELAADETYDCPNVHAVPRHAETFLAALLGGRPRELEPKWPKVLKELDELCVNGGFSKGRELPEGWTVVRPDCAAQVKWLTRPGGPEADKCLAYAMTRETADGTGIAVLSDYLPVEEGAHYRAACEILSRGPKVILFVKGYAEVEGQRREVFNHQARYYPEKPGRWERRGTEAFSPQHPLAKVRWLRVMLYAYHPAGEVFFDNVSVRKVEVEAAGEAPAPAQDKAAGDGQ